MADRSNQRLKAVLNAFPSQTQQFQWKQILILPDDGKVAISPSPTIPSQPSQLSTSIALDGTIICSYNVLPRSLRLVISSIGTQFEDSADHVPAFPVLEVLPPSAIDSNGSQVISIADAWAAIYALHTLYHAQETIPVILSPLLANHDELTSYILNSGLGRRKHVLKGLPSDPELFLSRETFWQGGGTGGYHTKGWLRGSRALQGAAPFPRIPSFTRTPSAVTPHPLRPPKPQPGEPVYRKYCPLVGEMIEFTYVDLSEGSNGEVGKHLAAFHKWHNDPRVNRGWGESGPLEKHVAYLQNVMDDPGVLPMIMSWSGELMGYTEITWIKESQVAGWIPDGVKEYDQGLHVLIGEDKFRGAKNRGAERSQAWFTAILHYIFLSDPRTDRVVGEPRADNPAILKLSIQSIMNVNTQFDLPYKRSAMTYLPRDRFFKYDVLSTESLE